MQPVILVILATLLLIGIIAYFLIGKLKRDMWEGELLDKREETSSSGDYETTNYALYVKTTTGLDKRVYVPKKLYNGLTAGDRLLKVKGETYPKKAN